jgi:hypothetical protein
MMEIWVEIKGWPKYSISNLGNAKGPRSNLKPLIGRKGYFRICMHQDGSKRYATIHSLVLESFVGPRPNGAECRHINGINTDNRLCNLQWGTSSENYEDKRKHGTAQVGELHGMSKLTIAQVLEIRSARMATKSRVWGAKILARKFGVSRSAVECAANGRNWNDPAIRAIDPQSILDGMQK